MLFHWSACFSCNRISLNTVTLFCVLQFGWLVSFTTICFSVISWPYLYVCFFLQTLEIDLFNCLLAYWHIYYDPVKFMECQHTYNTELPYSSVDYTLFILFFVYFSSISNFFLIACKCFLGIICLFISK